MEPIHILSLGAGVQSSTIALMATHGELTPMPVAAIFADTMAEPESVYRWLDYLSERLAFPVYRVSKGNLEEWATRNVVSKSGRMYVKTAVPAFIKQTNGSIGIQQRQCTAEFKIEIIQREIRRVRREHVQRVDGKNVRPQIVQWVGISLDEASRMKDSGKKYIRNWYPLVERRMTRHACLEWMREHGYPEPPRSACVFCPYHNRREWGRLKAEEPEAFQRAVEFERNYQKAFANSRLNEGAVPWLTRDCKPLDEVDFTMKSDDIRGQMNLFENDCSGVCGV